MESKCAFLVKPFIPDRNNLHLSKNQSHLELISLLLLTSKFRLSVQFISVAQSCLTLCDPMNRSMPGLPVHHQLPEFTQTHIHRVGDAIQPSHPLLSPLTSCPQSLPASGSFPMSQLFAWGGQSTGVSALASFLPKNAQGWSPLEWTGWISLQSKGLSRVFSNTTVQKHQFFSAQLSSQSNSLSNFQICNIVLLIIVTMLIVHPYVLFYESEGLWLIL